MTRGTVRALIDRTVSPSYVPDVSRALSRAIEMQIPLALTTALALALPRGAIWPSSLRAN